MTSVNLLHVVYINTQESSRSVYQQTVLAEPVKQVVAVGTGEQAGLRRTKGARKAFPRQKSDRESTAFSTRGE